MKKKMIALGVAVAMAAAVGCGATETAECGEKERIVVVDSSRLSSQCAIFVLVDTETGVQYMMADLYKGGGATVMLNPDGTPMIAEGYETEGAE